MGAQHSRGIEAVGKLSRGAFRARRNRRPCQSRRCLVRASRRNRLHSRRPVEKHKILLAIVLGLLGANLIVLLSPSSPAAKKKPRPPSYSIGQEIDAAITLVSTDSKALACASTEEIDGRHCELEAPNPAKPWDKPLAKELPPRERVLAPYKTTSDVMFLIPGLFSQPALVERLEIDPPVFGIEHTRFNAHCKLRIVGKMSKLDVRWAPNGPWYPATNVFVATASGCTLSG